MTHFYFSPRNSRSVAIACTPEPIIAYTLIDSIAGFSHFPTDLKLKNLRFGAKGITESDDLTGLRYIWTDYQPNSLAWPLMSAKMRSIIDSHASGQEQHEWLTVNVYQGATNYREYYLLRFREQVDVLNFDKSYFLRFPDKPAHLCQPVFAQEKIANLCVLAAPSNDWQITSRIYVSKAVRMSAKREGLVGLNFEDIKIS